MPPRRLLLPFARGQLTNASCLRHAEPHEAPDLDIGDIDQLARHHAALVTQFPWITVLGGCCGTDTRHVDAIAMSCAELYRRRAAAG